MGSTLARVSATGSNLAGIATFRFASLRLIAPISALRSSSRARVARSMMLPGHAA